MRDVIPGEELLNRSSAIGQYYGFIPLTKLAEIERKAARPKAGAQDININLSNDPVAETVVNFLKQYRKIESPSSPRQPLFVWHTNISPGRPVQKKTTVQFHAIGIDRAIADVVVIRAVMALVRDLFRVDPVVRINSMGDKETRARYARELGIFFKKRALVLPEECMECVKKDVFEAAELALARGWADDLPAPTEHLSDASRKRFEDLLEYLEMTETPYELTRGLLSRGGAWNDVCFEVLAGDRRVAWGSHYNDLARHIFPNAPFSALGAVLQIASEGEVVKKAPSMRLRFSFVHIGDEAKQLSLRLAEDFRRARVPIAQHIGIESLTEQLCIAERHESPYLLIMGRKEALEGFAILRNRQTQEETTIPLEGIIDRLKMFA